jgi:hypothetical protein
MLSDVLVITLHTIMVIRFIINIMLINKLIQQ